VADNTTLSTGSGGDTIHTDELTAGTYKMPASKIIFGTSGNNDGYWVAGAGAVGSTVPRVTLASDDPAVTALQLIDDAVYTDGSGTPSKAIGIAGTDGTNPQIVKTDSAGELQIDVLSIAAGTNAIGKLAANSGVDIGDVDVTSIAAGDNNIGNVDIVTVPAPLSTTGGGTEATALRVTVASDSTGVLSVDDNGAALTVDNGGTFAVQVDGAALTALQVIDNPVLVDDAAFTPATSSVMMAGFEADETATDSVDEGDAGAARMTLDRKVITTIQPHTAGGLSMSSVIGAATTNATVVKASAGQVYEIVVTNINAAVVYLKLYNKATTPDENDTPVWRMAIPGNTAGAGLAKTFPNGLAFGTGISYRVVGGVADNSTTAVSANEQLINVGYK
jgi:hypothetical protein